MTANRATYTFGPIERRGLLGPVRPGQALVGAVAIAVSVAAVDLAPSATGLLIAAVAVAVAGVLVVVPLGERTISDWAPVVGAHLIRRAGRRTEFRSPLPVLGVRRGTARPSPPPTLAGVRIVATEHRGRRVGALSEQGGRYLTAILACRAGSFTMLDAEAQQRRLAGWGLILSGAAVSPIRRLQWIERTVPAQGDELARHLHSERDPSLPLRGTPLIDSYLELIDSSTRVTQEHEVLLAIQVEARGVGDRRRRPPDVLVDELERVATSLQSAEVSVLGALSPGRVGRAVRTAFDPFARPELAALEAADPDRDGVPEPSAWPLATSERWEHCRADGSLHATYWIAGWPRVPVSAVFMDALLGRSGSVRTVAVTFEPIRPERSSREAEAAVTRDRADRHLRQRFGQSETARQRQAQEATLRREAELAAGHGEVRLAGFVTVSGAGPDELRRACAEVVEHAARARLELHRMYGQQAEAFTFTLPLCRGLR